MELKQKVCVYCEKIFPEDSFGVAVTTKNKVYRRQKCRDCYKLTKQSLIHRYHKWISEYKEQRGCIRCRITDSRVLDLHHKNEKDKLFTVGGFRRSVGFERIKSEIDKCEVVCANCHRILHNEKRSSV